MATDADGDSQMASSPESSRSLSDAEEPKPGSQTPTRPSQTTFSQFAGASELSPPGSQTQNPANILDLGKGATSTEDESTEQPGASWMSKRAQEEYQRAMEYVIDQDFSLDEFGDPFDESDMKEKLL
ncbi:uncharacterized protein BJX67DRAFT_355024 [Aspergillus lucknowensis]|uniref:Uncharacterized protein n=1 Tax=Aspergillus lucknowensis TaxID=176173 RepID=A0ABR4LQ27_9EURO